MHTKGNQPHSFRPVLVVASFVLLLFAGFVQAQTPERPKPGPEQKKLVEVFGGEWKYEGTTQETPLGPAGKFAGKQTSRPILGGLYLETKWQDKGTYGGKEIDVSNCGNSPSSSSASTKVRNEAIVLLKL